MDLDISHNGLSPNPNIGVGDLELDMYARCWGVCHSIYGISYHDLVYDVVTRGLGDNRSISEPFQTCFYRQSWSYVSTLQI